MLSPWVALYFGLTIITTAFTIWFWKGRSRHEDWDEEKQFLKDLYQAKGLMDLANSFKRSSSTIHFTEDDDSEVEPKTPIASST